MDDPHDEKRKLGLYAARVAFSKEAKRLRRPEKVCSRCLIVAIDAFNASMAEPDEDDGVIEC